MCVCVLEGGGVTVCWAGGGVALGMGAGVVDPQWASVDGRRKGGKGSHGPGWAELGWGLVGGAGGDGMGRDETR